MKHSGTFVVTFAGNSIAINWQGSGALGVLRFLYGTNGEATGQIRAVFHLRVQEADGTTHLYRADQALYEGTCRGAAAGILLDETVYALAQNCAGGPLFHAAALTWRERGLLIPGASGSGKTTTAAWLASKGFHYLSDELVFIQGNSAKLRGFYRPLHLKTSAVTVIERITGLRFDPLSTQGEKVFQSRQGLLVQAKLLNSTNTYTTPQLRLIIFPQYRPVTRLELTRLPKAEAGMRLMGCLVNARNLPQHGFPEIVRLAQQTPAYAMTYGCVRQANDIIETLLRRDSCSDSITCA